MRIYHKPKGVPYHRENSLRGIRFAAEHGFDGIDLDLQMTIDGKVVNTHWDRPLLKDGFRDPIGLIGRLVRVRKLKWKQVARLRTKDDFRINDIRMILRACAAYDIVAVLEPKGDKRFENVEVWREVVKIAEEEGARIRGYAIRHLGGRRAGVRRVRAMQAAGIRAHVIY